MKTYIILPWLFFLSIFIETNCRKMSSVFSHVASYDGWKCTTVLFERNVTTQAACTSLCLGWLHCVGVFYSRSTTLCTGCWPFNENYIGLEGASEDSAYFHNCAEAADWGSHDGSYYTLFTTNSPFQEAKSCCRVRLNTFLVHFDDDKEVKFVNKLAKEAGVESYWMGGEYDMADSKWKWTDDNTDVTFTDWCPGEPNGAPYQRCMAWWKTLNEKWVDVECFHLISFVCEKRNG